MRHTPCIFGAFPIVAVLALAAPPMGLCSESCRLRLRSLGTELGGKTKDLITAIKTAPDMTRLQFGIGMGFVQDAMFVGAKVQQVGDALFLLELTACSREGHLQAREFVSSLMSTSASLLESSAQQMFISAGDAEDLGVLRAAAAIQEQTRRAARLIEECGPRP